MRIAFELSSNDPVTIKALPRFASRERLVKNQNSGSKTAKRLAVKPRLSAPRLVILYIARCMRFDLIRQYCSPVSPIGTSRIILAHCDLLYWYCALPENTWAWPERIFVHFLEISLFKRVTILFVRRLRISTCTQPHSRDSFDSSSSRLRSVPPPG